MSGQLTHIVIAVMGVTGVGKSYFVEKASGQRVEVGDGLESCTSEVTSFVTYLPPYAIHLVDTPGFDDTHKTDAEILKGIADFLATVYEQRGKLSGILYLHSMTDDRMKGSAVKNLAMFKKLIGEHCLKNVALVTTKWSKVDKAVGERREQELYDKFWKPMVACQATMRRFDGTSQGALDILRDLSVLDGIIPRLTDELCLKGMELKRTAAGKVVSVDMDEQLKDKDTEIQIARREIQEAAARHDTEMEQLMREQKQLLEEQKAKMEADQALLNEYTRERQIRAVRHQNRDSKGLRWLGRGVAGVLGGAAIVFTGGLAAPLVAVGAVAIEAKLQEDREKDKQRLRDAM